MREREEVVELSEPRGRAHWHGRRVSFVVPLGGQVDISLWLGDDWTRFLVSWFRIWIRIRISPIFWSLSVSWAGLFGLGSARRFGRRGRGAEEGGAGHNVKESPDVTDCEFFRILLCEILHRQFLFERKILGSDLVR